MQDILSESLRKLRKTRVRKTRMIAILLVLSLVVSLDVFWWLRQPGLTLAGDADCGIVEHTHDDSCQGTETPCNLIEHIHDISCYSDDTADLETQLDWQKMFEAYPFTGNLSKDLVGIAKTQVGYSESKLNFKVNQDGIRHGYTRYGDWYGTPYSNWSATFVSFCLHYAGAKDEEYPINTGALSMAEEWKTAGKFVEAEKYVPASGDLVFFKNNTVGIVSEVQSATFYAICGDVENKVQSRLLSFVDESILGYGKVNKPLTKDDLYDISNGPAFFIFAKEKTVAAAEEKAAVNQVKAYSLKNTRTGAEGKDLLEYLEKNGGTYFFSLIDTYNHELPRDENGNLLVHAGTKYKLTMSFSSPDGFAKGTYQYQLPGGFSIDLGPNGGKPEELKIDGTVVGTWSVTQDGLVTLTFNDEMNNRTEVTISATLGVEFPVTEEPVDFDGKITVTVEKPREEIKNTEVNKWGTQGNPDNENVEDSSKKGKTDPTKIYWTIKIEGNQNSQIPGSVVTDKVFLDWGYEHYFSDSDIAAGLTIGASEEHLEAEEGAVWHSWKVSPDDPNLTWDANLGWSYTMPEVVWCEAGNHEVVLGNNNWTYFIEYTTTPVHTDIAGKLSYYNQVEVDNKTSQGSSEFTQTEVDIAIFKNGKYVADAGGGKFVWEIQATLPGRKEGNKATLYWRIDDQMELLNASWNGLGAVTNDIAVATVTANYYGTTIQVPRLQDATENDLYALSGWPNGTGSETIVILHRCLCNAENCVHYAEKGSCGRWGYTANDGSWVNASDFCDCWLETEDTTFTITYETKDTSFLENYSGLGYMVRNMVKLYNNGTGNNDGIIEGIPATAVVPVPQILDKEIQEDFDAGNPYIAKYVITVNESKLQLTDGSSFVIKDEMSTTLVFIRGRLEVEMEDADGNTVILQEGVDYVYEYDGSGTKKDDENNPIHLLEVEILHPQPAKYTLKYDATIQIPEGAAQGKEDVKYQNSVSISVWDQKVNASTTEKIYPYINLSSKAYSVLVHKIIKGTTTPLEGAVIGLFNDQGHLVAKAETGKDGRILFETDIENGVFLREHILYYIQEIQPPPGYKYDDTRYWFCFCDKEGVSCDSYSNVVDGHEVVRVPFKDSGHFDVPNEALSLDFPSTGGIGVYPLILVSVTFVVIPLVYRFIPRRKRERRGDG